MKRTALVFAVSAAVLLGASSAREAEETYRLDWKLPDAKDYAELHEVVRTITGHIIQNAQEATGSKGRVEVLSGRAYARQLESLEQEEVLACL